MQLDVLAGHCEGSMSRLVHPLRVITEIIVMFLVAEVHVSVTPHRSLQLRPRHNLADGRLYTSQSTRPVPSIDSVEYCTFWYLEHTLEDSHRVLLAVVGKVGVRLIPDAVGEDRVLDFQTILGPLGHVRVAKRGNKISLWPDRLNDVPNEH